MDLKELGQVNPSRHWYYQVKVRAIRNRLRGYLPKSFQMLEVGAGSGFFTRALAQFFSISQAWCVDPNYSSERCGISDSIHYLREVPRSVVEGVDLLLFIDVLEHVDDDAGLLRKYVSQARPGALVLVTVPAFMSLWSSHDVYLEHHRRYRLKELRLVAESAGLQVVESVYLFGTVFPVAWIVRRLRRRSRPSSDMKSVPMVLDQILRTVCFIEHRIPGNKAFGLSALVLARV